MKIKLIRTGGFIPITKSAEVDVNITIQELGRLLEIVQADPDAPRVKDGHNYILSVGNTSKPVDLEKVPDEYKDLFGKLKSELRINK